MATNSAINTANPIAVSSGGLGTSSLTAYTPLCGGTTSTGAVQSVSSTGSSGAVLVSGGASALPTFTSYGTSAWVLLQTQDASSSSSIDFTSTYITSTYNNYVVVISNLSLGTTNRALNMRVSTDGGSSWLADGNYNGNNNYWAFNSATPNLDAVGSGNQFKLTNNITTSAPSNSIVLFLLNVNTGGRMTYVGHCSSNVSGGSFSYTQQMGYRGANGTNNGIRFVDSAGGNIATGRFSLYGLAK